MERDKETDTHLSKMTCSRPVHSYMLEFAVSFKLDIKWSEINLSVYSQPLAVLSVYFIKSAMRMRMYAFTHTHTHIHRGV